MAVADHLAGLSSVMETQVEGSGSMTTSPWPRSPPPTRECPPPPPSPAPHPGLKTYPPKQNKPQRKSQSPFRVPSPKEEEASGQVLLGALLGVLNGLLLLLLPYLQLFRLVYGLARARHEDPTAPQRQEPPRPPKKAPKPSPKAPPPHSTPASPMAHMPRETPLPKPKPKPKARGAAGRKYKLGNVYGVFCDKVVWGVEQGKDALAAGGPPPKGKHG